ncbi:hypothetical protein M407DRAFT_235313 [Tulasnella calospora MUT 4182]|uniref:Uncharacterized protein n=1 Tax=Tulasnella calospora MUT 4182 TaxID=1051891 RepID=A0A0C3KY17_9AGAM|nr:hypothetical protein M407DRAFT_235313 [Tulasnella calospora MUT 4182]
MTVFTGPSQLPTPRHCLGLHNIPDDGDVFEQLTRTIAEYEPINRYLSVHPAASSTIIRVVGSLQVNKELPPLPTENPLLPSGVNPLSSGDESLRWYRPLNPPHEPKSQAFRAVSHSSTSSSLSINAPPSLGSRTSALSGTETCTSILNSNFGTSRSNSLASAHLSAPFTGSRCYSPSSGQTVRLLAVPEGQSWSDPEAESSDLTSPPSPLLQNAPHNHILGENPLIEPSIPLQISHLVNGDSDALSSEKAPRSREALLVFDGDCDSPDSVTFPLIEWEPLIPTPPITPSPPKSDLKSSRKRTLSGVSTSVPRLPSQLQAPPPPKHPPRVADFFVPTHSLSQPPPTLYMFSPNTL